MNNKAHWAFWLLAVLGLLWNAAGAVNYLMQFKPEYVASLPDTHRAIVEGRPVWATIGFAVGVFAGVIACLLLLLKKSSAGFVFMISLIGIFVTMIHTLQVVVSNNTFSVSDIVFMVILPIVVANVLIGFTIFSMKKNWIS